MKRFWFWLTGQKYCLHCKGKCTRTGSIYDEDTDDRWED